MSGKTDPKNVIPMQQDYDVKREAEKNTIGKRLHEARKQKGWSIRVLNEKLEAYNIHIQAGAVNKWELGLTVPNSYQLFALCRLLEIEDGVRYFSGPLRSGESALNEQGLKKVEAYRNDLIASGLYNCVDPNDEIDDVIRRPVYDLPVSAGGGNFLDGEDFRMETFRAGTVPQKADFALIVSGDSMMPDFPNGQMVWVQETPELRHGEVGIFVLNGSAYMKLYTEAEPDREHPEEFRRSDGRIGPKVALVSLNTKYDPISVGEFDEFRIVGRVLTR